MPPAAVAAVMVAGAVAKGRAARKDAKSADKNAKKLRKSNLSYASPENYLDILNKYKGAFKEQYAPGALSIGENIATGTQGNQQAIDASLGRRGLSGSGIGFALQNANNANRGAEWNQTMRDFYSQANAAARQQADVTTGRQTGTAVASPLTYTPRPSWGEIGSNAIASGFQGYAGMGGNPYLGKMKGPG
jgi:hypothetical protein